jgi:hypothetical protein
MACEKFRNHTSHQLFPIRGTRHRHRRRNEGNQIRWDRGMSDPQTDLIFDLMRSVRYHDRRRAHFERLHRATNVVTILLAGIVLMELSGGGSPLWVRVLAVVGALLGATDLVIGFSKSADAHHNFKRRFSELESEANAGGSLDAVVRQRLAIEAEEPPIFRALDLLCYNEICAAVGHHRTDTPCVFAEVPWYMRWTANWLRWPNAGETTA